MNIKPKVVILCGGRGSRMEKETEYIPKPLLKVGGKPIIWHIMKTYAHYGFNEFILCLGYKGNKIKKYFLNYETINSNFTLNMKTGWIEYRQGKSQDEDWKITFVDTGENAQTGARVKKIEEYIDSDTFMLTYGDGVADINIKELLDFHSKHRHIGTVTGVYSTSRFGELSTNGDTVTAFSEKQVNKEFINGGFFVFNKLFFHYLSNTDDCILEKYPLEKLAHDKELNIYSHKGFWQCMDTQRELIMLNDLWNTGKATWRVW